MTGVDGWISWTLTPREVASWSSPTIRSPSFPWWSSACWHTWTGFLPFPVFLPSMSSWDHLLYEPFTFRPLFQSLLLGESNIYTCDNIWLSPLWLECSLGILASPVRSVVWTEAGALDLWNPDCAAFTFCVVVGEGSLLLGLSFSLWQWGCGYWFWRVLSRIRWSNFCRVLGMYLTLNFSEVDIFSTSFRSAV